MYYINAHCINNESYNILEVHVQRSVLQVNFVPIYFLYINGLKKKLNLVSLKTQLNLIFNFSWLQV